MQKFVCVRMVDIDHIDLSIFQFDAELTWATFFMNADKTIYGRYGSRSFRDRKKFIAVDSYLGIPTDNAQDVTYDGFVKAVKSALKLHQRYISDTTGTLKKVLGQKKGPTPLWKTPESIPSLSRGGCIHCHHITTHTVLSLKRANKPIPDKFLWTYPMPNVLGIKLDPKEKAKILSLEKNSQAKKIGLQVGDEIEQMQKQPILSIADVQWVLQQAPEEGVIAMDVVRGDKKLAFSLPLSKKWRRKGSYSWRWRSSREIWRDYLGSGNTPHLQSLSVKKRKKLGLEKETMAVQMLKPDYLRQREKILLRNDIIINVDNNPNIKNASDFQAYVIQEKKPGDKIKLVVVRNGGRVEVELDIH